MARVQSPVSPERAPERLCELNTDALAAVLLDAAGALAGCTDPDRERAERMAGLARELFSAVDSAASPEPAEQVEAQVQGGAVFASRTPRWTLAVVARRAALSSLMLYDLRAVLGELEEGPPIVVREAAV
jgi:hypothetical protein